MEHNDTGHALLVWLLVGFAHMSPLEWMQFTAAGLASIWSLLLILRFLWRLFKD